MLNFSGFFKNLSILYISEHFISVFQKVFPNFPNFFQDFIEFLFSFTTVSLHVCQFFFFKFIRTYPDVISPKLLQKSLKSSEILEKYCSHFWTFFQYFPKTVLITFPNFFKISRFLCNFSILAVHQKLLRNLSGRILKIFLKYVRKVSQIFSIIFLSGYFCFLKILKYLIIVIYVF